MKNVIDNGVTPAELDRAKHQIEAHFILSRERTLDQAILLGQMESIGTLDYIDSYVRNIQNITAEQLADVCNRYLNENNRTVALLLSDGSEDTVDSEEADIEAD
jgi:predicted Zn-dependent peptidase